MINIKLPVGLTLQERLTLLKWRDPVVFFTDVTGDPPFKYQEQILKEMPDLNKLRFLITAGGNTGKTRLLADIGLWSPTILGPMIMGRSYSVIIESGSQEQSRILYDYLKTWIESNDLISKLVKGEPLKTNTTFKDGSFIKALPASWKCYDEKTEILTKSGFKKYNDLKMGECVATLNKEGFLEWQVPIKYFSYNYDGQMLKIKNRTMDILVTCNHKMLVARNHSDNFELIEANSLPIGAKFKRTAKWKGKKREYFIIPSYSADHGTYIEEFSKKKIPMEIWVEFLGYYLSEGSVKKDKCHTIISQSKLINHNKFEKIKKCLDKLPFSYSIYKEQEFSINSSQLGHFLYPTMGSYNKKIPKEIKELDTIYLEILLDALMLGDGVTNEKQRWYSTVSEQLRDDVMEVALKLGIGNSYSLIEERTNKYGNKCSKHFKIYLHRHKNSYYKGQKEVVNYNGKIWCLEVPNNTLFIRRNGKTLWSGNSIYGQHSDLLIIDEAVEAGGDLIDDSIRVVGTSLHNGKSAGRIILSSTPHNYMSKFVTMWEDHKKYNNWLRRSWSALACPLYTEEVIEEAKKKGKMYYDIFILGKPYPLMGTMINIEDLKNATKGNPIYVYNKEFGYTVMGLDWGFAPDPTALVIIQRNDRQIRVFYYKDYLREDPEKMCDTIQTLVRNYNVERIFSDSHNKHMNALLRKRSVPLFEVSFKGEKGLLQANLTSLFENGVIKIPEEYIRLIWQIRQYTYETKGGDDFVDALMLACKDYKTQYLTDDIYYKKFSSRKKKKSGYQQWVEKYSKR